MVEEKENVGLGDIISEQEMLLDSVQKTLRNFKKDSASRKTESYHQTRLDSLASYRAEFRANHRLIVRQQQDAEVRAKYVEISDDFEETYIDAVAAIRESLATRTQTKRDASNELTSAPVPSNSVPLPEVKLPTFSGNHIEWPAFKEVYLDRIHHNESLNSLQRFHYLKAALTGDASQDIQHIGFIGENYLEAWKMLCNQFDNNRILFTHYMDILDQQPDVTRDDPVTLKHFTQTCRSCFRSIKNLGVDIEGQNQLMVYFLIKKLPNSLRNEWDRSLRKQITIPTFAELLTLLDEQYLMLLTSSKQRTTPQRKVAGTSAVPFGKKEIKSMHTDKRSYICPVCEKADHPVRECSKFIEMSVVEKRTAVEQYKLCFNCLGYNHRSSKCSSRRKCGTCGGKHHTLIHSDRQHAVPILTSATHVATNGLLPRDDKQQQHTQYDVLLPTAIVIVKSAEGKAYQFRALLDQGSQASFVTERVVQILGLQRDKVRINVHGLAGCKVTTGRYSVDLKIGSRVDPLVSCQIGAYVLPKVAGVLPEKRVNTKDCSHLQNLELADPRYFEPLTIDILLGSDVYDDCILDDTRRAGRGLPIAQKTTFGYIISGKTTTESASSSMLSSLYAQLEIDHLLRKFWELEEVSDPINQSSEDQWCEKFYTETHERLENGKYLVRLPLKSETNSMEVLGKSRAMALKRFCHLERRLLKDKALRDEYIKSIREYLRLGQMKPVTTTEDQHCLFGDNQASCYTCCYLPHHPVVKESSTSTRMRIVFDASAKTSNGKSLNDILATGPALQEDLSAILTNWRLLRFVFMADVQKMFRCIDMHEEDAQYQRILWREDPNQPIQEYYCTTVMFGTACAPYLAIRTMHQLVRDEGNRYPLAADIIERQMYVDDILSGSDTIEAALRGQREVISMLRSASFELRKWASNHDQLLDNIPPEHRYTQGMLEFKSADVIKALGLYWDPCTDEFKFKINFEICTDSPTKRSILSTIARLFDPLGWLNPIIISAKIIMQRLWSSKTGWDAQVPEEIQTAWRKFGADLPTISQLRVPRWLGGESKLTSYELHLFSDASKYAYSAVAYLRLRREDGQIIVNLLMAKCKVNPIKPKLTIPRAELCGAVLAINLLKFIKQHLCMHIPSSNIFLWTDSSIVLSWIREDPSRWKPFVSNRIAKILTESTANQWRHIASENNPADVSSRGIRPSRLVDCNLWWHGPAYLQLPSYEWPVSKFNVSCLEVEEQERRKVKTFLNSMKDSEANFLLRKWSSFSKTVRMVAYCIRFYGNCRPRFGSKATGMLSIDELRTAVIYIVRLVQQEAFPSEWISLSSGGPLPKDTMLRPLNPFFDQNERVIRLGGRLKHALLSRDQKHPFIIPAKHPFTALIIQYSHLSTMHGGVTLTLNHIRSRFWILNGRNVVRHVIHRCIICYKNQPRPCTQMMGALPAERVRPARAFSSTGVDYAGPFNVLPSKGRGRTSLKGYVALFICLSTKAIHMELVGDLTADAFIGALDRFISRRGICSDIYSDCGTNFIGANRQLKEDRIAYQRFIEKCQPQLTQQQIRWHFIPPSSPHFGGLWEAGVKSTKYHLKRTIGEQKLTYEELSTVLAQIESCLNSRPLCPLTNDPDDLMVLTPGHFLIGDSLLAIPRAETNCSLSARWRHCQMLVQQFWKQWTNEYLSRLQRRPKWLKSSPNLKINDIVMIKDERFPCNHWPLGRIVDVHPGTDNLVRVVTLKTKNGLMKRPIVKLCPLPIQNN